MTQVIIRTGRIGHTPYWRAGEGAQPAAEGPGRKQAQGDPQKGDSGKTGSG